MREFRGPDIKPTKLLSNAEHSFLGTKIYGQGFTLTPEEREALVARDPRNAERIFPYLGGKEVNTSPTQSHDRYVINFGQMSLEEAARWPDLLDIVRDKVKPERDRNNRANYRNNWWQFGEARPGLYKAIAPLERCLVTARVSKHLMFTLQPTDRVFSEQLYVSPLQPSSAFAVLQSKVHEPWVRLLSSSMKTDLRYAATDCFETFPFPREDPKAVIPELEEVGRAYYEARASYLVKHNIGLTKFYNDHPLPELKAAMDDAVCRAYGWYDSPSPDTVVDRLFVLNSERALSPGHGR